MIQNPNCTETATTRLEIPYKEKPRSSLELPIITMKIKVTTTNTDKKRKKLGYANSLKIVSNSPCIASPLKRVASV